MLKQLEISQNSLIPSAPKLWKRSGRALADAKACLDLLKSGQAKNEYEVEWCNFVCRFDDFKKTFRSEGSKNFTAFKKWYDPIHYKIGEQDPLFKYLYKTRCAIEHTSTDAVGLKWTEKIEIANNGFCGHIKRLRFYSNNTYEFDFTKHPSSPDPNMEYCYSVELDVVINRSTSYYPPKKHLGKSLGTKDPAEIGKLAISYYENLFYEAKEKFGS